MREGRASREVAVDGAYYTPPGSFFGSGSLAILGTTGFVIGCRAYRSLVMLKDIVSPLPP